MVFITEIIAHVNNTHVKRIPLLILPQLVPVAFPDLDAETTSRKMNVDSMVVFFKGTELTVGSLIAWEIPLLVRRGVKLHARMELVRTTFLRVQEMETVEGN